MNRQTTSENAINQIGNRYETVIVAAKRVRELKRGDAPKVMPNKNNKNVVTALEEIEQGHITRNYLYK